MKTAMQEHIDWLKSTLEICEEHATPLINCLKLCISDAESKLEMEKEQMKEASLRWVVKTPVKLRDIFEKQFEDYYNETYKSE